MGEMESASFWDNQDAAQKVVAELKLIKAQIEPVEKALESLEDAKVAYEMGKEEGDNDLITEADEALFVLQPAIDKLELQSLLSGKHDHRDGHEYQHHRPQKNSFGGGSPVLFRSQ